MHFFGKVFGKPTIQEGLSSSRMYRKLLIVLKPTITPTGKEWLIFGYEPPTPPLLCILPRGCFLKFDSWNFCRFDGNCVIASYRPSYPHRDALPYKYAWSTNSNHVMRPYVLLSFFNKLSRYPLHLVYRLHFYKENENY